MNRLLRQVFEKVSRLPEEQQQTLAYSWLADLEDELKWNELFATPESEKFMKRMDDQIAKRRTEIADDARPGASGTNERGLTMTDRAPRNPYTYAGGHFFRARWGNWQGCPDMSMFLPRLDDYASGEFSKERVMRRLVDDMVLKRKKEPSPYKVADTIRVAHFELVSAPQLYPIVGDDSIFHGIMQYAVSFATSSIGFEIAEDVRKAEMNEFLFVHPG